MCVFTEFQAQKKAFFLSLFDRKHVAKDDNTDTQSFLFGIRRHGSTVVSTVA